MSPTLQDKDLVFTLSLRKGAIAAIGDIIVLRVAGKFIVKRVFESNHDSIVVASDSDKDTSVYCHRSLSRNRVVGKVVANF